MKRSFVLILVASLALVSCKKIPITGRKQVKLLPSSTLNSMALTNYKDFLNQNQVSTDQEKTQMVKEVGKNIQTAVTRYFTATHQMKLLEGYSWEFNLVNDPAVNAWCMPGGKVVVYSGLLPVAKNRDGLAVVMGHEIAHAIANHGNERMSQGLVQQMGGLGLQVAISQKPAATQQLFMGAYGVGSQVGAMLPFSRLHESEADRMGLIFMAMAGYNPEEGGPFWERMGQASGGQSPPEFLSTHPAHSTRIKKLKEAIPEAKSYAQKYGTNK